MALLSSAGEKAGLDAAKQIHQALDEAVPALGKQAQEVEQSAVFGLTGLIAQIRDIINGAECPVNLTLTVTAKFELSGKIGQLKLTVPEWEAGVKPSVVVEG